jgi:acetyl-CoA carboxylase biotin carboxyl carrier protein
MDFKQIQELIRIVNKSNIGEVSIEEKGFKLTIKQKQENVQQVMAAPQVMPSYQPAMPSAATQAQQASAPALDKPKASAEPAASNLITIKSPMIGTFYRRSAPEKPSFVEVGTEVSPGKVVCIIEAMKLFNEIESEVKGTIVKILVEDSSPVEYDQPLFMVEPA